MNTLISIITPVYNVDEFIVETIESVLKQTYSNWELLLIDDGSTDNSAELCKQYADSDSRIKYFHKVNGGQASARNLGIENALGEYVTFLDSDDLYCKDKLEQHFKDLINYPADFYYGATYMLYQNKPDSEITMNDWFYGEFTGDDFYKILYHSCAVVINSVFVKKELFKIVGVFDESQVLRGTEDWDLWLRIALKVKKVYGNHCPKVYYRIHDGGIHFQRANMLIGKWRVYEKHENNLLIRSSIRKREYRYIFRELMNNLMLEGRSNEVKKIFKEYWRKDKLGLVSFIQFFLIKILPINIFLYVSTKIIYRFGYRIEHVYYKISK